MSEEFGRKKNIIEILCHRYKATLLFFGLCLCYGLYGYLHISRENIPEVKIPYISIFTELKGSTAEDVDIMITKPIERKLRGLQGVKKITSTSAFGYGLTIVEFDSDANVETSLSNVKDKIDEVRPELPKDIEDPSVKEIDTSRFPVLYVMMSGDVSKKTLIHEARELKKDIEMVKQVLEVKITGDSDDIVEIVPNPAKMKMLDITANEIERAVSNNNILIPLGKIRNDNTEFNVKLSGLIKNVEHIKNIPIRRTKTGIIYLHNVANVNLKFDRPERIARVNQNSAIVLEISKRSGANIIEAIEGVKETVSKQQEHLKDKGVFISYSRDSSDSVKDALLDLQNNVIFASLLVVLIIILSIGKKQSLIIGLSIPFSFLMAMGSVYMLNYTLNIVVLFGFILSVGMIVDTSTIVVEYADKLIKSGMPLKQAYIKSACRMAVPVISATVGIIVVYMPLMFWPGVIGKFMKYIPIVVILVLSYSILCAMLVVPVVAFVIEKTSLGKLSTNIKYDIFSKVNKVYEKILIKVIENPKSYVKKVCIGIVLCFVGYYFFNHGTTFFPDVEPKNISLIVKSRSNMSLNQKTDVAKDLEDKILKKIGKEIKVIYSKVGAPEETNTKMSNDTIVVIDIELINWKYRRCSDEIIKDLKKAITNVAGVKIEITKDRLGPNTSKPIELRVLSQDLSVIKDYANDIYNYLDSDKQYKDIDDSRSTGKTEIVAEFDKNIGMLYGIVMPNLYYPLSLITNGYKIGSYRLDDIDTAVDIIIKAPSELRNLNELKNLTVHSNELNKNVAISNFVTFKYNQEQSFIKRTDGYYSVVFNADLEDGVVVSNKIKELQKWLDNKFANIKNIKFAFGSDAEQQRETGIFLLFAFVVAICIKFLILVAQYNSIYYAILTLSVVFLAIGGVLVMFVITGRPFCVSMVGMGIISIAGIAVSNNIVLIDTFQELLNKEKMALKDAVIKTALSRLRPILITTTTTVAGLIPMMLNFNIDFTSLSFLINAPSGQWWQELAITICGGVCCSLILTLTFTPAMLMIKAPKDNDD